MNRLQHHLQQGATLIISLVMLVVVLMLSASLGGMAQMNEKAARNERDQQIALHAAEAALTDAELDIENAEHVQSRSAIFSPHSAEGFTQDCGRNTYQGLCTYQGSGKKLIAFIARVAAGNSPAAQFGQFTGQTMPLGSGPFPSQLPRYVIELMPDNTAGHAAGAAYIYRITAIGFGTSSATQVVLQSFYRKTEM